MPAKILPIVRETFTEPKTPMIPSAIEDEEIQVAEQDYGLICPSSGQLIPLKAFHVRAELVDITAEVIPRPASNLHRRSNYF